MIFDFYLRLFYQTLFFLFISDKGIKKYCAQISLPYKYCKNWIFYGRRFIRDLDETLSNPLRGNSLGPETEPRNRIKRSRIFILLTVLHICQVFISERRWSMVDGPERAGDRFRTRCSYDSNSGHNKRKQD